MRKLITRDIIQLIKDSSPGLGAVLIAVDFLKLALNKKEHNSMAYTEEIRLTANNEMVNVDRLTIAGDINGKTFTLEVNIMDTLADPENSDNIVTRLPEYIKLTATFNKYLVIHAIPSKIAQIIFNKLAETRIKGGEKV